MFDRAGIYERFAMCYDAASPVQLAKTIGINHASAFRWRSGAKPVPWKRLKQLVNEQNISWDWLIEGREPKHFPEPSNRRAADFDWPGINRRFLDIFPDKTQQQIAEELGVGQVSASKWKHAEMHVPWEKLKYATETYGVRWEWLIEGRDFA